MRRCEKMSVKVSQFESQNLPNTPGIIPNGKKNKAR